MTFLLSGTSASCPVVYNDNSYPPSTLSRLPSIIYPLTCPIICTPPVCLVPVVWQHSYPLSPPTSLPPPSSTIPLSDALLSFTLLSFTLLSSHHFSLLHRSNHPPSLLLVSCVTTTRQHRVTLLLTFTHIFSCPAVINTSHLSTLTNIPFSHTPYDPPPPPSPLVQVAGMINLLNAPIIFTSHSSSHIDPLSHTPSDPHPPPLVQVAGMISLLNAQRIARGQPSVGFINPILWANQGRREVWNQPMIGVV